MDNLIKQLTGKNKQEYEKAAAYLVDSGNLDMFKSLVDRDDFLFEYIKQNVSDRIRRAVNSSNYRNLYKFLKIYSQSYADTIVESIAEFGNDDDCNKMLELFKSGSDDEKAYCARYFGYVKNDESLSLLRENSFSDDNCLSFNCAVTLGILNDDESYKLAIQKLEEQQDDFENLKVVKFLTAYGNKDAIMPIIECMASSALQENIAGEIPYLINLFDLLNRFELAGLFVINNIINGLGETIMLSCVLDFELYDIIQSLIAHPLNSVTATVLLNAREKFETLTENNEYTYDEDKNTKDEIENIKRLLTKQNKNNWLKLVNNEVREDSLFVYTALDYCTDETVVKELLRSSNQTLILRAVEVLKNLGALNNSVKTIALAKVSDINIKNIIHAL